MYKNIALIKGRHQAVMNGDLPIIDSNGNLLVQDVQDNSIFTLPLCMEALTFFDLKFAEEELPTDNNASSSEIDIVEQSESTISLNACWKDDNEVRCLINLWHEHQNYFKNMKSRNVWALISEALSKTNSEWKKKTPIQCENKWKDIKRKYTEIKNHNNKSGNEPKTYKFFEELEEVLGEKPCVKPIALVSNHKKRKMATNSKKNNFEDASEDSESSKTSNQEAPQQKKNMTKIQRELRDWSAALFAIKDWSAAFLAEAKAREEAKERRHTEIIAESRAAVEAYKEFMGKLIDKL